MELFLTYRIIVVDDPVHSERKLRGKGETRASDGSRERLEF